VLTVLIVVALLVALGGTTAGVLIFNSEKRKRGLPSGDRKALPGDVLRERSLKELKVGDVLTIDGNDYLAEGVIEYDEDGHRWVGARVVDGLKAKWCMVGLERVGSAHVRVLEHDTATDIAGYPPEALVIGEVRFALDKRGNATAKLHGDLGNLLGSKTATPEGHVERCRWWLYSSSGDDTVALEQWGADYRVLKGKKVSGDMIDLIPGS
jgi:hypothetical protein